MAALLQCCCPPTVELSRADLLTSPFVSPTALAAVRAVAAVWHCAVYLTLLLTVNTNSLPQMCYLTFWSYMLIVVYLTLGTVQFARHRHWLRNHATPVHSAARPLRCVPTSVVGDVRAPAAHFASFGDSPAVHTFAAAAATANSDSAAGGSSTSLNASVHSGAAHDAAPCVDLPVLDALDTLHWSLFEVLTTVAPIVTAVYWFVIFPTKKGGTVRWWADTHVHALNSVVMLADLFLGKMKHAPRHVWKVLAYAAVYGAFSFWVHSFYGYWPYGFQDPTKTSHLALVYCGLVTVFFITWLGVSLLPRARDALAAKCANAAQVDDSNYSHL